MFNKVIIIGNLTRDVELRYLPSGSALATIGLASNHRFKKQDGSDGEEVCFIDVKLFGRSAEVANQYLKKGSKVLIEGRLTLESWTDQSGAKKSRHTIIAESMKMMDSKMKGENDGGYDSPQNHSYQQHTQSNQYNGSQYNGNVQNTQQNNYAQNIPEIDIDDEDIPF